MGSQLVLKGIPLCVSVFVMSLCFQKARGKPGGELKRGIAGLGKGDLLPLPVPGNRVSPAHLNHYNNTLEIPPPSRHYFRVC